MSDLRTEGLLAKPGGKSKSGMSFEIVDMNSDLNESFVSTSSLLPSVKLRYWYKRKCWKVIKGFEICTRGISWKTTSSKGQIIECEGWRRHS